MRLLLVDDHQIVREVLAERLIREPGITAVDQAENADAALAKARANPPDLVVMDIEMPGSSPFEAAASIRRDVPNCKVIFLTGYDYDTYLEEALAVQARGYVIKSDGLDALLEAIHKVAAGEWYFSRPIRERLMFDGQQYRPVRPRSDVIAALSKRERELLVLLGKGATLKEAAARMQISFKTADNQKSSLMRKLGIHDRVELVRFAIREGLIDPT
ncbi:MAG: response regulator transcription factor [Phycisphaerae bacterium]|jgi:DNA-binding NarL/FixJ family response regulator